MKLDVIRDYLTLAEVASRWGASDADMRRAVLKGLLKPVLYVDGNLMPALRPGHELGTTERHCGWRYVQRLKQVGPLDCIAAFVSVEKECDSGGALWELCAEIGMSELLSQGAVLAADLLDAEEMLQGDSIWQARSAQTKEVNSLLKILSILLADYYGFDPRCRNTTAREIEEAGRKHGVPVSEGTARKWIHRAIDDYPPTYMSEPRGSIGLQQAQDANHCLPNVRSFVQASATTLEDVHGR